MDFDCFEEIGPWPEKLGWRPRLVAVAPGRQLDDDLIANRIPV